MLRERREKYNEIDREIHETMRIYVGEKNFNQKLSNKKLQQMGAI